MARILVIEDNMDVRSVIRQFLELAGHRVMVAANGLEGLKLFRQKPFDLIITDLIMPIKDGIETIMELRSEFPDVKTIAISGGGLVGPDTYLQLAESFGAACLLRKPFKKEELLKAVDEVLAQS